MATTTIKVTNASELMSALKSAKGGETIVLADGHYGELSLNRMDFGSNVTIVSQNPEGAVFSKMTILSTNNLTIDGVFLDYVPDQSTVSFSTALKIDQSNHIKFVNSLLEGGPAVNGVDPSADKLDSTGNVLGLPAAQAVRITGSTDVLFENNVVTAFHKGILLGDSNGITINQNEVYNLRTTPLNGGDLDNVVVTNNYFHDSNPWSLGGAGDHADFIHFWTVPTKQTTASENFLISNNVLQQGAGQSPIPIYFDDNLNGLGFKNVDIVNNVIQVEDNQGIRLEFVNGGNVSNNTMIQRSGDYGENPSLILKDNTQNLTIDNNILGAISGLDKVVTSTIKVGDNLFLQGWDPMGDDFVGNYFMNALNHTADPMTDLLAIPGGLIDTKNYGSALTQPTLGAGESLTVVNAQSGENVLEKTFNVKELSALGEVDISKAKITWDFGDGTKASGMNVTHTFADGGRYDVTATVNTGLEIITVHKTVLVQDLVLLDLNLGAGGGDSTIMKATAVEEGSTDTNLAWVGKAAYIQSADHGTVAHFTDDGSYIKISGGADLNGMQDLMLEFDIQFEKESGDRARPVWGSSTYGVEISGEALTFFLYMQDGSVAKLKGTLPDVQNGDWHTLKFVYDGDAHTVSAMMDGEVVASMEGVTGAVRSNNTTSIYVGGDPWGAGFTGNMSNLTILNGTERVETGTVITDPVEEVPTLPEAILPDYILDSMLASIDSPFKTGDTADDYFNFNGSGYAKLGKPDVFFNPDELTVSFDLRSHGESTSTARVLWNHARYGVELTGDDLNFRLYTDTGGSYNVVVKDTGITDGNWHNASFTFDAAAGTLNVYVDGDLVGSKSGITGNIAAPAGWDVTVGGTPWGRNFDGDIANLNVYSLADDTLVAKAADTVTDVADATDVIADIITDVIASDGAEAPASNDAVGDDVISAIDDAAAGLNVIQAVTNYTGDATDSGDALHFNGNGYASIGRPAELMSMDELTLTLDVKPDADNSGTSRLFWAHGRYGVELSGDDITFRLFTDAGDSKSLTIKNTEILDGDWHQVTMSFDSETGTLKGFFDGELAGSLTGIKGQISNPSEWDVTIGGTPWGRNFKGEIDNVRVWGEALEPAAHDGEFVHDTGDGLAYNPEDFWSTHMQDADLIMNLR
ncbi:LamG-like jellyroll fold domain-containing protein [Gimibacter soli]|uniref:LamG domain-containing protein n=1 Tax=Gimibacter soli TaxID=3024400 RepID=A0AAE9XLL8_9PROT|nr:LamG-like jellyroll fold domain-containing protein [Gimibacter soli]WCL53187.1 LamG domain-containing protein [Gimibacter soli]